MYTAITKVFLMNKYCLFLYAFAKKKCCNFFAGLSVHGVWKETQDISRSCAIYQTEIVKVK